MHTAFSKAESFKACAFRLPLLRGMLIVTEDPACQCRRIGRTPLNAPQRDTKQEDCRESSATGCACAVGVPVLARCPSSSVASVSFTVSWLKLCRPKCAESSGFLNDSGSLALLITAGDAGVNDARLGSSVDVRQSRCEGLEAVDASLVDSDAPLYYV